MEKQELLETLQLFCNELEIPAIIRSAKMESQHYGKPCAAVGLPLFYDPKKTNTLDDKIKSLNLRWFQVSVYELMDFPESITNSRIINANQKGS